MKEFKKYCHVSLDSYKVPKDIQIVDYLDRTASGKLVR